MNNPTEGKKDGTCVSNGTFTSPIRFEFSGNHTGVTRQKKKLAIRTEEGYKTFGQTYIRINDANERSSLSWTEDGIFTPEISTNDEITDTNKIFYITSYAHGEVEVIGGEIAKPIFETAGRDTSVSLEVVYLIKKI